MRVRVPFKNLGGAVPQPRLAEGRSTLLLIDCIRYSLSPADGYARVAQERGILRELEEYYEQLQQVVPNLQRLTLGCRERHVPIVFTRLLADDAQPERVGAQARALGLWASSSSAEAAFMPGLEPLGTERVVDRRTIDALTATSLQPVLDADGTQNVIIAGVLANEAVMRTAHTAADLGYHVVVAADATAAETWGLHTLTATLLVGGLIRLRTVTGILEMLDGRRT